MARLVETKLNYASIADSWFGMTVINEVNLAFANVTGIEHRFPSIVDDQTIVQTATALSVLRIVIENPEKMATLSALPGLNPEAVKAVATYTYSSAAALRDFFLRSGRSKDDLLVLEKLLPEPPKEFESVFISYSTKDEDFARRLDAYLCAYQVDVWFAPNNMRGGQKIRDQLERAIGERDKIILVLSEASLESNWVAVEISKAVKREMQQKRQILYPIRITDFARLQEWDLFDSDSGVDVAKRVREYFIPDFSRWDSAAGMTEEVHRLIEDLRRN
ncbi:MAG: toll/interleukin-1 receptor domain-containing protein [Nitrososphaera sp.]|nr:toll/interleukin-1 receptor domain-containing protein [Nitrososphaera sp.]